MVGPQVSAGLGGQGPAREVLAPEVKVAAEYIIDNSESSPLWGLKAQWVRVRMSEEDWTNADAADVIEVLKQQHPEVYQQLWREVVAIWLAQEEGEDVLLLINGSGGACVMIAREGE